MALTMNRGLALPGLRPSGGSRPAPAVCPRASRLLGPRPSPGRCSSLVAAAAKGLSLHIGLNSVDPAHYNGWSGELNACEYDANDMEAVAKAKGFDITKLLTKDATRDKVLNKLQDIAKDLKPGDIFLLTYSGHGGQVNDVTGEESDSLDETWCLYDSQLIDDELYYELCGFSEGVRILVLSDSCHSGTITKAVPPMLSTTAGSEPTAKPRMLGPLLASKVYLANKDFYDKKQMEVRDKLKKQQKQVTPGGYLLNPREATSKRFRNVTGAMKAATILISGCQDNQLSRDGMYNGLFTEKLLTVWNSGLFKGSLKQFHSKIKARMPSDQTPNFYPLGPATTEFAKQPPFTIVQEPPAH